MMWTRAPISGAPGGAKQQRPILVLAVVRQMVMNSEDAKELEQGAAKEIGLGYAAANLTGRI